MVLFAELPEVRKLTCQHLMGCKVLRREIMISFLQLWNISKHKNDLYTNLLSRWPEYSANRKLNPTKMERILGPRHFALGDHVEEHFVLSCQPPQLRSPLPALGTHPCQLEDFCLCTQELKCQQDECQVQMPPWNLPKRG